jgi:hypothetical protein
MAERKKAGRKPAFDRAAVVAKVVAGLRLGTPLTHICAEPGMPCDDTIRDWAEADAMIARDIARAREVGFDQIALEALAIADDASRDTKVVGEDEREVANTEWISRSKLRVETRLKLLAKWDPKRYGDRIDHTSSDGSMSPAKTLADFYGERLGK